MVALVSSLTLYSCTGKEPCCIAQERFTKEISKITCTMAWERTPFQMDAPTKASFARTGIKNPFLTGTVQHIDKARGKPKSYCFIMPFYTLFSSWTLAEQHCMIVCAKKSLDLQKTGYLALCLLPKTDALLCLPQAWKGTETR